MQCEQICVLCIPLVTTYSVEHIVQSLFGQRWLMVCINVERGESVVESRNLTRENPRSDSFAAVLKLGHFRYIHNVPVHSAL